jgi:hypothetical protein
LQRRSTASGGRFSTSSSATGTWRVQSVIFDHATFPADKQPVDECDTGS